MQNGLDYTYPFSDEFYSSENTRGLFDGLRFVVRLHPEVDEALHRFNSNAPVADWSTVNAFSTFLHETIHWWQHVGSTTGLMLSFSGPAKAHVNHQHLLKLTADIGPIKPLLALPFMGRSNGMGDPQKRSLNIILNNWHDLEFNYKLILDPKAAPSIIKNPYFDSVGHSIEIGLANSIWMLSSTVDRNLSVLPDIRTWDDEFDKLRRRQVKGYYPGSPVKLTPFGALHIFEGQARFTQLQYLYLASDKKLTWKDFADLGMLDGIYIEAFDAFRKITGLPWPNHPALPEIHLFLLVCELAINPSDGYPFQLEHFESFIESVVPGIRFYWFCHYIRKRIELASHIRKCSHAEYVDVATELCRSLVCRTPLEIGQELSRWSAPGAPLAHVLEAEKNWMFPLENLPVSVYFAKHLSMAKDRCNWPEFFCWPAMFMVDHGIFDVEIERARELFERHRPLFFGHLDGEIRPTLQEGKDESRILQTFNDFFVWVVQYDLVDQWIARAGQFNLDISGITKRYSQPEVEDWIKRHFQTTWNISLDDFKVVV